MEDDVGDVVRPRCLPRRLEGAQPVALAGVLDGTPLPLPHAVVLVVRCRRWEDVPKPRSTATGCSAAPKGAVDRRRRRDLAVSGEFGWKESRGKKIDVGRVRGGVGARKCRGGILLGAEIL